VHEPAWYTFVISVRLWLTVVFANVAEAFAEGRGRAHADTLRPMRRAAGKTGTTKSASQLVGGDNVQRLEWLNDQRAELSGIRVAKRSPTPSSDTRTNYGALLLGPVR